MLHNFNDFGSIQPLDDLPSLHAALSETVVGMEREDNSLRSDSFADLTLVLRHMCA